MGLDIIAYSKFVPVNMDHRAEDEDDGDYEDGQTKIYANPGFPGAEGYLTEKTLYSYEEDFHFRAGSYSGYNEWRRNLCQIMHNCTPDAIWKNYEEWKDKPFTRLINFSDAEGTIGADECKKLYQDFKKYEDVYVAAQAKEDWMGEYNIARYKDWMKACQIASENGAICFH